MIVLYNDLAFIYQIMVENDFADGCELAPDAGPCYAMTQRFYFDPITNECKDFVYGGCLGNSNNFATREKCRTTCRKDLKDDKDQGSCARI